MQFSKTQNVEFGNFLVLISHRRRHLSVLHQPTGVIISFPLNYLIRISSHNQYQIRDLMPQKPIFLGFHFLFLFLFLLCLLQNQPPRGPPIQVQNGPTPTPWRPNNPRRLLFPGLLVEKQRHLGSDPSPLRLGPPHRLRFRPPPPICTCRCDLLNFFFNYYYCCCCFYFDDSHKLFISETID